MYRRIAAAVLCALSMGGATVQKLSLDDMILKSTAIVRGRAASSRTAVRGAVVYTFHKVTVQQRWKGTDAGTIEVAVPGGVYGGLKQTFAGTPVLQPGTEYVMFLWAGRNGVTQVIGLSQGVLDVKLNAKGERAAVRAITDAQVVDAAGQPTVDTPVRMSLNELDTYIRRVLAGSK